MLTTGMSMFGKMSVGVRTIERPPKRNIKIASTTIVYGCFSASLTIHIMIHPPDNLFARPAELHPKPDLMACALGSWYQESISIAELVAARRLFRIEQFPWQEFSGRTDAGCRHCPDGLWNLRGILRQTSRAPVSSSRFRNAASRPYRPRHRGRLGLRPRKRRRPA